MFLEHFLDIRIVQLESRVGETALLVDAFPDTLQAAGALDGSGGEEVRTLREIAAGPHKAHREVL